MPDNTDQLRSWFTQDGPSPTPPGDLVQTVLDSLTHPFYVIDVATHQLRAANRAAREMHGVDGAPCYTVAHKLSRPCEGKDHPCPIQTILRTRQPTIVEHIHHDSQGNQRHVEVHAFPMFSPTGDITQVIEYCVDITEHKRIVAQHAWELAVNKAIVALADALIDPTFSIEEVADLVLDQTRQLTGSEHGFVSSIDAETGDSISHTLTHMMGDQCRVSPGQASIVFPCGPEGRYPGLWGHALNTNQGFYANAPEEHPASTGLPAGHIPLRNFLTVPAVVGRMVVGQIALANTEDEYEERHLDAIRRIAKLYALAVQRRRTDEALRKSKERYALAQKAANIGSWDWNIATDQLLWSERIEPMFGFAPGQFGGTYEAFLDCVHPDDRQPVIDAVNACIEGNREYAIEHRVVWPDGTIRWVSETGDVIRNAEGKAIRMLGVVQDITDRKRAESQIRDLALFASENPSPVLRIRGDGVVLYSNRPGQTLMRTWRTQPDEPVPETWRRRIAGVLQFHFPRIAEECVEGRIFSLVLVPIRERDYVNIYGLDVTEQKKAEGQIHRLNQDLEKRVLERTEALTQANRQLRRAYERRQRLEREVLEISEREQRRIGGELHDSLGQQLTGIAILTKVLEQKLQRQESSEAEDAKEIALLVNQAVEETRQLSRGLHPVALDEKGLMSALQALAMTTESLFRVSCVFRCDRPVLVRNASMAVHLYRIAQEAVTNAIRHGDPQNILIELSEQDDRATLTVLNDGRDFPEALPEHDSMGLQVMSHRAEMIDGALDIQPNSAGGTRVTCTFRSVASVNQGETEHEEEGTSPDAATS